MWTEVRTPNGKLLFRVNVIESLVESVKDGWIVLFNLKTQEVISKRKTA
jgi:hypothetical protein